MYELLVASDLARRRTKESFEPRRAIAPKRERSRPRRAAVRAGSAAALRQLADRLEPRPTA